MGSLWASVARPSRTFAIVEGLLLTMIWGSSFVLTKQLLEDLGPLTISGLRYSLGFLCLVPFLVRSRTKIRSMSPRLWQRLFLIGLSAYTIGNGAIFWSLEYLSPMMVSLLENTQPAIILIGGAVWLRELPTQWQILGIAVSVAGGVLFFSSGLSAPDPIGLMLAVIGIAGFVAFTLQTRGITRDGEVDTLALTALPLAMGGLVTLLIALAVEGLPSFTPRAWGIVWVLALVNTALGYVMFNHSLRVLQAFELNVILNFIPLATAFFAWVLLGDRLTFLQVAGVITVIAGVALVQMGRRPIAHRLGDAR